MKYIIISICIQLLVYGCNNDSAKTDNKAELSETTQDAEAVVIPSYSQDTTFNY